MPADITTERLLGLVTWEWQDAEELMQALIPTVPPGKALRTYQTRAGRNMGTGNRPELTEDEQIASGARSIVNDRIGSQAETGRLEVDRDADGRRRVRFRERREVVNVAGCCPTCNRPFVEPTLETKPQPAPVKPRPSKVVFPNFPQWERTVAQAGGESE